MVRGKIDFMNASTAGYFVQRNSGEIDFVCGDCMKEHDLEKRHEVSMLYLEFMPMKCEICSERNSSEYEMMIE